MSRFFFEKSRREGFEVTICDLKLLRNRGAENESPPQALKGDSFQRFTGTSGTRALPGSCLTSSCFPVSTPSGAFQEFEITICDLKFRADETRSVIAITAKYSPSKLESDG